MDKACGVDLVHERGNARRSYAAAHFVIPVDGFAHVADFLRHHPKTTVNMHVENVESQSLVVCARRSVEFPVRADDH